SWSGPGKKQRQKEVRHERNERRRSNEQRTANAACDGPENRGRPSDDEDRRVPQCAGADEAADTASASAPSRPGPDAAYRPDDGAAHAEASRMHPRELARLHRLMRSAWPGAGWTSRSRLPDPVLQRPTEPDRVSAHRWLQGPPEAGHAVGRGLVYLSPRGPRKG